MRTASWQECWNGAASDAAASCLPRSFFPVTLIWLPANGRLARCLEKLARGPQSLLRGAGLSAITRPPWRYGVARPTRLLPRHASDRDTYGDPIRSEPSPRSGAPV